MERKAPEYLRSHDLRQGEKKANCRDIAQYWQVTREA